MTVEEARALLPLWCATLGFDHRALAPRGYLPKPLAECRTLLYTALRVDAGMTNAQACRVLGISQAAGSRMGIGDQGSGIRDRGSGTRDRGSGTRDRGSGKGPAERRA